MTERLDRLDEKFDKIIAKRMKKRLPPDEEMMIKKRLSLEEELPAPISPSGGTGAALGDPRHKQVNVSRLSAAKLSEIDSNPKVDSPTALAKLLFCEIFREELDTIPHEISCSESVDGKQTLNKLYMEGIRRKL